MIPEREPSLEHLLDAYPGLTVLRQPLGHVVIGEEIAGLYRKTYIVASVKPEDQPLPYVNISVGKFPKDSKSTPRDHADTSFIVLPSDDEGLSLIGIYRNELGIDVLDALEQVKHGFEIFDAFTSTPMADRVKFKSRVGDLMEAGTLENLGSNQIEFEKSVQQRLREIGLVYDDHDPRNDWRYAYWVLRKEVADIQEMPI